jgi:nitroreductase
MLFFEKRNQKTFVRLAPRRLTKYASGDAGGGAKVFWFFFVKKEHFFLLQLRDNSMTQFEGRTSDYDIEPIFLQRWSPRAFTGAPISDAELFSIFEAARWAPSSYNSQPWRFLYAKRDTAAWPVFLGLLGEFNQGWAKQAAVLIIVLSKLTMRPPGRPEDIPSHSHSFDAGAAWANLALQATAIGWHAHAMVGFDIPRSAAELGVPEGYRVEAAIAIGRKGDKSTLPEMLQAREAPNEREPVKTFAFEGGFPK